MKKLLLSAGFALATIACSASTLDYTYNFNGGATEGYGYGKTETYDVAIRLQNPSFTGAKVTGIRVPLTVDGTEDCSAWLTSELKLKKKNGKNVNDPDIATVSGEVNNGWLDIRFDTPYTIPAEGVYVGYSFSVKTVNEQSGSPVMVAEGTNADGLYIHSTRTKLRWGPMSEELGKVSAMTVTLDGTFPERSATFSVGEIKAAVGEQTIVILPLVNCGTSEITTVEYSGAVAGQTFNGATTPQRPLLPFVGATGAAKVEIPGGEQTGDNQLTLKVTKINGFAVEAPEAGGTMKVYPFIPVNRPLVEEYTGLWCGWCPRGYVALETMKERKGDRFIAVAYHNGDPMAVISKTPNTPGGYPAAYINRSASVDLKNIYTEWGTYRTWIPEGGVEVAVEWTDESHTAIRATAKTRFPEAHSRASYRVSYILVADGLKNARWKQHNSFSGRTDLKAQMPGELGDIFINGSDYVEGLIFNDVAISVTDYDGEIGSVPAEISAGEEYTHVHIFELGDIEEVVLSAPEKLRVVAVLTDGNKFINCNSSAWMNGEPFASDMSGINGISTDANAVEVARYTLEGRRIAAPVPGVNIIRYSDGTVRKVMVVNQ